MGKTVYGPHFNRDTAEFASRERDGSKPGIKILLPFLKNVTEESDLENFQDLILALNACYWLHKVISVSLSRFGDDRRVYLGVRTCELFPCFVPFVFLGFIVLTSLFSLFYVTCEFNRFLHRRCDFSRF